MALLALVASTDEIEELARRFALQNAIEHEGQANPGAVIGRIMSYDEAYRADPKLVAQTAGRVVAEVSQLDLDAQKAELAELGEIEMEAKDTHQEGLPELAGLEGLEHVVMRFAPNPNGPPSLGHSRGMCINGYYAREHDGELILRFDDTDPVNKAPWEPAYAMFEEAFAWLELPVARTVTASDRLEIYYEHAERALEMGAAYTCTCTPETFREHKANKEACPHREEAVETQLARWEGMLDGSLVAGDCVVRIKTDMSHKDPALRDWVALRVVDIEDHPHCRTGTKHRVWPMLDFESAIEDHLQGTTHIIRGKDLMDSERKQRFLYDHFGWDYPEVLHWGRVSVHGFGKFSTSQMRRDIEAGEYTGWDDPRLPTLAALKRRGFLPEAIMGFWVELGLTEKDIQASLETLEAENRKRLDQDADRLFFVPDPAPVRVEGLEEPLTAEVPRHPDHPDRGTRSLTITDKVLVPAREAERMRRGVVFRLKDGCDLEVTGNARAKFRSVGPGHDRDGPILQWATQEAIACTVLRPDGSQERGVVERTVLDHDPGAIVQFERYGFVRLEVVDEHAVQAVFAHR